jgi:CheY-like chemotaxis protein
VESKYGEGTTFAAEVVQDVVDDSPVGDFAANLARLQLDKEEFRPALVAPDAKILIVDDNEMNLEVISELLSETRIQITTAQSGADCITCLKEGRYDVVLLDQMMPVMSGSQTLSVIREEHLADDTPIIVLTADAIVGARDSYIKEGFTDYLSKPIMYRDLEDALLRYIKVSAVPEPGSAVRETDGDGKHGRDVDADEKHGRDVDADGSSMERLTVLAVSDSTERLNEIKELLGDRYKGVFVRDEEKARKYLSKHEVAFIIRDN